MINFKLKTYWNTEGKNQEVVNRATTLMPSIGYTSNKYMNLFIAASQVYYDYYNNGGCNLKDSYAHYIDTYIKPFIRFTSKTVSKKLNDRQIEKLMDKVTDIIKDKDLSFNMFEFDIDFQNNIIMSKNNKKLPDTLTFDSKSLFNYDYKNRVESCGCQES